MAVTGHGHHIPGSPKDMFFLSNSVECGGVGVCPRCGTEAQEYETFAKLPQDNVERAKAIVERYVDLQNAGHAEFSVRVTFFAYILKGWKATVSTDLEDQLYYEVTYDTQNNLTYLDVYEKKTNICIPN